MCGLAASPGERPLIVVLDGDEALREALRFSLETEGYRVRAVATAKALRDCVPGLAVACFVIEETACDPRLYRLLRGRGAPVILLSTGQTRCGPYADRVRVVEKPLMTDTLSRQIAAAVAGRAESSVR